MNSVNANDPEIQNAIFAAISKYGTQKKFGALVNIPQSRISQWKNGHGSITPSQWERVYPYIRDFLSEKFKPFYRNMAKTKHIFSASDIQAIRKAVNVKYGSEASLARAAEIPNASSVNQYCNGVTKSCTESVWRSLYPLIAPYYDTDAPDAEINIDDQKIKGYTPDSLAAILEKHSAGRQIVTGVINVHGIPVEKVIEAIRKARLSEEQRRELREIIFS